MRFYAFWMLLAIVLATVKFGVTKKHIPTTLNGPFEPVTRRFDPSLRRGSDDLPLTNPRLKKNVSSNFPEQIAVAISSPTAMWVSWVTGIYLCNPEFSYWCLLCVLHWSIKFLLGSFFVGSGDAQIGLNVTPLDPSSVGSEVWYGKGSGKYTSVKKGNSLVYSQLYPFEGLWNYTSGIIHHVKLDGAYWMLYSLLAYLLFMGFV